MRCGLAALFVLFAAVAHGADDTPKATGTLNGKRLRFPEKGLADGLKAPLGQGSSAFALYWIREQLNLFRISPIYHSNAGSSLTDAEHSGRE